MRWKLTVRAGPRVKRSVFPRVADALDELEARGRELIRTAPEAVRETRIRHYEPDEQVVARLELAGPERIVPSVRAGVDVRGDGSVQAYHGRVRREVITPRDGDLDAFAALRRTLTREGAQAPDA